MMEDRAALLPAATCLECILPVLLSRVSASSTCFTPRYICSFGILSFHGLVRGQT